MDDDSQGLMMVGELVGSLEKEKEGPIDFLPASCWLRLQMPKTTGY
jgi:hypothetical protein